MWLQALWKKVENTKGGTGTWRQFFYTLTNGRWVGHWVEPFLVRRNKTECKFSGNPFLRSLFFFCLFFFLYYVSPWCDLRGLLGVNNPLSVCLPNNLTHPLAHLPTSALPSNMSASPTYPPTYSSMNQLSAPPIYHWSECSIVVSMSLCHLAASDCPMRHEGSRTKFRTSLSVHCFMGLVKSGSKCRSSVSVYVTVASCCFSAILQSTHFNKVVKSKACWNVNMRLDAQREILCGQLINSSPPPPSPLTSLNLGQKSLFWLSLGAASHPWKQRSSSSCLYRLVHLHLHLAPSVPR